LIIAEPTALVRPAVMTNTRVSIQIPTVYESLPSH
jgi:hypothetical protein